MFGDPAVKVAVGSATETRTEKSEPPIWFEPSGKRPQSKTNKFDSTSTSDNSVIKRLEQLEQKVQALQAESASQREEIEKLKRQSDRT